MKRFKQIFNHQPPARLIALGFASTILLGTLLLLMPFSIRSGITVQPVDALFSATSAVCVTGLLTVDTADTFTPVGQAVMAVLIQIGGLGITSIGMGLALAAGRRISLRERTLIREAMNVSSLEGMVRLVCAIIKLTLAFELAGVIPIFAVFAQDYPPLKALGLSVFHSISSFNNAGIDILGGGRSLAPYRDNVLLNLSTCFLIISGGIGFLVMVDVVKCRFRFRKFTLHSKVVVTTTAFLLAAGALLLKFTDPLSWLTAFFLSVSARTAGFATLDLGKLSNAGLFTILILMFIGASPGSTGGGIKTTTVAVLALTVWSVIRGDADVQLARRRVPPGLIRRALAIVSISLAMALGGTMLLTLLEGDGQPFLDMMFEAFSAMATVGVSSAGTPNLTAGSKTVLALMMFFGRVGGLTLIYAAFSGHDLTYARYPKEMITVG